MLSDFAQFYVEKIQNNIDEGHFPAALPGVYSSLAIEELGYKDSTELINSDGPLHNIGALIKNILYWAEYDRMSKKQQSQVDEKFETELKKPTGAKQYMVTEDWKHFAYLSPFVLLPFVTTCIAEAKYMWWFVFNILCLFTIDLSTEDADIESLSLCLYACAMGAWLLLSHMIKIGVDDSSRFSLYAHNLIFHTPRE